MKLRKITLSALAVLALSTTINAKDKCDQEIGNVFGERDSAGQSYKDFLEEQKGRKEGLAFLVEHCDSHLKKYEVNKKTIEHLTKSLNNQIKASEAEWEKEYKLKY